MGCSHHEREEERRERDCCFVVRASASSKSDVVACETGCAVLCCAVPVLYCAIGMIGARWRFVGWKRDAHSSSLMHCEPFQTGKELRVLFCRDGIDIGTILNCTQYCVHTTVPYGGEPLASGAGLGRSTGGLLENKHQVHADEVMALSSIPRFWGQEPPAPPRRFWRILFPTGHSSHTRREPLNVDYQSSYLTLFHQDGPIFFV